VCAGASASSRIWTDRHFSGDAYFSGSARELAHALAEGDNERVKELLPAAGDLNRPQGEGTTLLQFGILQANESDRSLEMVRSLLAAGGDPKRDTSPLALEHAIARGPRLTKLLLDAGANPNVLTEDHRPVWWSAIAPSGSSDLELLTLFLEHGADVQWRDKTGRGPVAVAVNNRRWNAVSLLIEHGAGWKREQMTAGATLPQLLAWEITRWQEGGGNPVPEEMRKLLADLRQAEPQLVPNVPEPPAPGSQDIARLFDQLDTDKPEEYNAVLARLVQQPNWVQRAAAFLDPTEVVWVRWNAGFLLTLRPDALDEGVQEQCWMLVRSELADVPRAATASKDALNAYIPRLRSLSAMTLRLATIPGPVRESHRADLARLRERVEEYRKLKHPEASKLPEIGTI
jgi:hypothetical protein